MNPIRIVIVEDDEKTFIAEKEVIEQNEDLLIVDHISENCNIVERVKETDPDVVLMDINLTSGDDQHGIDMAIQLSLGRPEIKVVMLSGLIDEDTIRSTMGIGAACNYIVKTNPSKLPKVIRDAYNGDPEMESVVIGLILKDYQSSLQSTISSALTSHEIKMLELFYRGHSTEEVAKINNVETQSVRNAQQRISKKCFGWKWRFRRLTTFELAERAKKLGLF